MAALSGGASEAPEAATAAEEAGPAITKETVTLHPSADPTDPFAQDLRKMWGEVAQQQSGTSPLARAVYTDPNAYTGPQNMFADGGEVDPQDMMQGAAQQAAAPLTPQPWMNPQGTPQPDQNFIDQLNAGIPGMTTPPQATTPQAPAIGDILKTAQSTPATNYDFYKDMSAEDRMNLYKQLQQQGTSTGSMVAQGLGGLGDAIARSFGGQQTNYQQGIMNQMQLAKQNALGAMDTERAQKLQDLQAQLMAEGNDPNSDLSKSARDMMKAAGLPVADNMSYAVAEKFAPEIANLALKQAMLGVTTETKRAEIGLKGQQLSEEQEKLVAEHPFQNLLGMLPGQGMTHPSGYTITRIK
jgi:hypothetical protein